VTTVDLVVVSYTSFDATVNPVSCSGDASAPYTLTLVKDAAPTSVFTYANTGGRELTYTAGTGALADTTAPAGITAKTWAIPKLSAVALNTVTSNSTDRRTPYRFSQTADNLSVVQNAADDLQHFVPEGDLTAAP